MADCVSIISPCYNGEAYIHRMLDSILNQTYEGKIELIIINDGSEDRTEEIINSYRDRFAARNISFIYLKQENKGQSAAINQALPVFSGNYVSFVDSDDILSNDAIAKKVEYMNSHKEIGLLINKIKILDFDSLNQIGTMERKVPKHKDHLAADLISGKNVFYTPGGYFWRSSMFRDAMPKPLQIVAPREIGQNFQLILPIAYKYPVGYIDEYLYYYLIRKGSHSRTKHTYEQMLQNWNVAKFVLTKVSDDMESDVVKRSHIQQLIDTRYYGEVMKVSYNYGKRKDYAEYREKWLQMQYGDNRLVIALQKVKKDIENLINSSKTRVAKIIRK